MLFSILQLLVYERTNAHEGHCSQTFSLTNWTSRDVRQVGKTWNAMIIGMMIALRQWCRCWPETLPSKGGLKKIAGLISIPYFVAINLQYNTNKRHSESSLYRAFWLDALCLEVFRLEFAISKNRHEGDLVSWKLRHGFATFFGHASPFQKKWIEVNLMV